MTRFSKVLHIYFRSGWAFFIPYLATYLLYAWLKWPVNPASGGEGLVKGMSESAGAVPSTAWASPPFTFTLTSLVPPLLHVYWFLHALHLVLGALALRAWWRESGATVTGATDDSENTANHSATPQPLVSPKSDVGGSTDSPSTVHRAAQPLLSTVPLRDNRLPLPGDWPGQTPGWQQPATAINRPPSTVYRLLPWIFLGLLFWIPGVYLEWPSDPWEHLRRINEWRVLDTVTAHSSWVKSSYFIPYSLLRWALGLRQIFWLDFYYTGICLLLCWQYYRLARACDLGERASMMFVILQALLFGNNIFSFYRYYGISSSIYAQLGAVALTRIALEVARSPQLSLRNFFSIPSTILGQQSTYLPSYAPPSKIYIPLSTGNPPNAYSLLLAGISLLALISFNHVQGIGIAALGIAAVAAWRLVEWKRAMIGWLALAALLSSIATVLWFPRHPTLDGIYRPLGWLTTWYGFNLFSPTSPAFEKTVHILGAFGVVSLIPAFWLVVRRNHVGGWLTLMPVIALALPCFALPFAHVLAIHKSVENIITFHRMLFAVPMGLALVATLSRTGSAHIPAAHGDVAPSRFSPSLSLGYPLLATALLLVLTLFPGSSVYNRFWHSVQITPNDLQLKHYVAAWSPANLSLAADDSTLTITSPLGLQMQKAFFSPTYDWTQWRQIHAPQKSFEIERTLSWLHILPPASSFQYGSISADDSWPDSVVLSFLVSATATQPFPIDLTATGRHWLRLGGVAPVLTQDDAGLLIGNPAGQPSHAFSSELIAIDCEKRYLLASTIRQVLGPTSLNYLAVAWYDRNQKLLPSYQSTPEGADMPLGWLNDTYSYYGLRGQATPSEWTTYRIALGQGEIAVIPSNAVYLRVGAILNDRKTPAAQTLLRSVILQEKPDYTRSLVVLPSPHHLYSTASAAAQLSEHWPAQHIFVEHAGLKELQVSISALYTRVSRSILPVMKY